MFQLLGVQYWLGWIAMILAVISTASIFPDLMTGGSIDLYLSKPIGRLRLFLTKYAAGMVFVALQVAVFSGASFLVIGFRGGSWEPRLFLAIPLVVCMFSYLWSVCVLVGVMTRSTLAAALVTLIVWMLLSGLGQGEFVLLMLQNRANNTVIGNTDRIRWMENQAVTERKRLAAVTQPSSEDLRHANWLDERWHTLETKQRVDRTSLKEVTRWHTVMYWLKTVLPKPHDTNDLLSQHLLSRDDLMEYDLNQGSRRRPPDWMKIENIAATKDMMRDRSVGWVVGTSLLFELVVLSLAATLFCRRDF